MPKAENAFAALFFALFWALVVVVLYYFAKGIGYTIEEVWLYFYAGMGFSTFIDILRKGA
jgi:hypothetical protein